jgi:cell division protein FtsN
MPKDIILELNYTKYKPGQTAINYNYLEERKVIFTLPIKSKNFSIYNRITYNNVVLPGTGYSTADWLISGGVMGVNTNLTTYATFIEQTNPYVYSNLSFSFRLPRNFLFLPQAQYEYGSRKLISVKLGLEKSLFKNGYISLSYENFPVSKIQSAQFSFRYDLPFAQTGFTARQTNDLTTLMEMGRGSLIADHKTNYVGINNRVNVGKGGIVFSPFLDLNCNNKRDPGEPKVSGLNIRINGGRAEESVRDTVVRVSELEPYLNYLVELDPNSFDNIAWKIHNKTLSIAVDPNMYKLVEIPIAVVGEVSGTISHMKGSKQEGMARITVNIYDKNAKLAGKTMSEQDGYFSFLGLAPGSYDVRMDSTQMKKLHLISTPASKSLTIKMSHDGDIAEGFDFLLKSTEKETIDTTKREVPIPEIRINNSDIQDKNNTGKEQKITTPPKETGGVYLQVGAFINEKNAQNLVKSLAGLIPYPTSVIHEGRWYKVFIGPFSSRDEIDKCKKLIVNNHILPENMILEVNRHTSKETIPEDKIPVAQQKQKEKTTTTAEKQPIALGSKVVDGKIAETGKVPGQAKLPVSEVSKENGSLYLQVAAFQSENNAKQFENNKGKKVESIPQKGQSERDLRPPLGTSQEYTGSGRPQINHTATGKEYSAWKKYYFVEIGSFKTSAKATKLIKKVENMLSNPLEITFRDNLYRVRYGSFETEAEANECIRQILLKRVTELSKIKKGHEEIGANSQAELAKIKNDFFIQVGAFNMKENAVNYYKFMSEKYHYPIVLMEEDGFYKVRFGPFRSLEETKKYREILQREGVDCFGRSSTVS